MLETFAGIPLSPVLARSLENMGVSTPTPIQTQVLPLAQTGVDLMAVAQTGSGKTLAFALSVLGTLQKDPTSRALVLAPSREMAMQIHQVFESLWAEDPLTSCLVIGGVRDNKHKSQLKKNPRLIVATPGRLNDLLRGNKLLLQRVAVLVIDEADRMLDLGFAPQLKDIRATMRGQWQTLLFSASGGLEILAKIFLKSDAVTVRLEGSEAPVPTLRQKLIHLKAGMKNQILQDQINAVSGAVLVFCSSQENCEQVGRYLQEYSHAADYVHGAFTQGHRSRVIRDFRAGRLRIVVTTDLLARGLDFPDVELVVNFDLPSETQDFLHRIGRTARAGRQGLAVTLVTAGDAKELKRLKAYLAGAEEQHLIKTL